MADSGSADELIDRVVEKLLSGQDPDVEGLIGSAPELPPATRESLRKVARTFGPIELAATARLQRDATLPFTELGSYRLVSRMGEGGMGTVYLAEHKFLARRVALKLIRPELALSEDSRRRFHREAMNIAKLRHDNIVSVYDAGEHDGVAFLAMELVDGQGLDELLHAARSDGRRMDVTSAVRHARGIALALQCAHDAGIIHRDVKPANVRITPDGRELLLDFGLSLTEEMGALSSIGHFRGTPLYASPEQIESDSASIDARTDVYSLGVTLYECLTGQVPFAGSSMHQLFHQILAQEPLEPSKLNDGVDAALNGIVMRAVAKRREDRFASAGEMARALDAWLQDPARAAPASRRGKRMAPWVLPAAIVLVLGSAVWLASRARDDSVASAPQRAQPVVLSTALRPIPLLGTPGTAFNERLNGWDAVIGAGTFGADEDGSGVSGSCADGIAAEPRALPGGAGCVAGRFQPMENERGERTLAAGVGLELSSGRTIALLLVAGAAGYDLRACELAREGDSRLVRGSELESVRGAWVAGRPFAFKLSWNETDVQFDWGGTSATEHPRSLLIPRAARGTAQPSRFLLLVEKGNARFEELVLEEP